MPIQFEHEYVEWDLNKNILFIGDKKIHKGKINKRNDLFIKSIKKLSLIFQKQKFTKYFGKCFYKFKNDN